MTSSRESAKRSATDSAVARAQLPAPRMMLVDPRFGGLAGQFFRLFGRPSDGGGALALYLHGEPVVDIWSGWATPDTRWQADTVSVSFSTGKGVASTVLHRLVDRGLIIYDAPVAEYWPEFASAGKELVTVRELLTHRAGLQQVRGLVPGPSALFDHDSVVGALASATPDRRRAVMPGYHAVTFGSLVAELTTRATGSSFTDLVRTEIAEPLGVGEFWFQVPAEERHRIAKLFPRINPFGVPWETASFALSCLPVLRNIANAGMPEGFDELVRNPAIHDYVMPGWNGVFSARALARMYAAIANRGVVGGNRFLSEETLAQVGEVQTTARDYVLGIRMNWRLGYHSAFVASRNQSPHAFGHYGLGGSGAFADPETGLSVAFVTNRMGGALTPFADLRLAKLGAQAESIARRL
ncbi:esterase [Rhodococcus sp. ACS1]|uniref:CubicO group peptidase, beta-lactamase class C family n=1 Tax=Rhodococcus koreensis TaxID=99653 RepID=A0A1H5EVZ1_9NOCA|nr:esterase [Rhodococcus sp. ACS1]SED95271.1 CubicO group peptidase, beta-lactamase class C family [Rhodococcus koreensis]